MKGYDWRYAFFGMCFMVPGYTGTFGIAVDWKILCLEALCVFQGFAWSKMIHQSKAKNDRDT
jgi:hypothetical protein